MSLDNSLSAISGDVKTLKVLMTLLSTLMSNHDKGLFMGLIISCKNKVR